MFWIFKLMAQFAVIILATVSLSNADLQEFFATRLKGKTVATSYLTLKRLSQVRCAEKCYNEGRCRIAGYNKVTKVCRLSNDSQQDVLDIADDSSSVFIYQQEPTCASEVPLVSGEPPIPDWHMTASSEWDSNHSCHYARLNNTAGAGSWCPTAEDRDAGSLYIQVQFINVSAVTAIQTQGGSGHTGNQWMSTYRLEYSRDCLTFNSLLDVDGSNKTFPGNTDNTAVVENRLSTPITALCIRLRPLTWNWNSCVRMEVLGCVHV